VRKADLRCLKAASGRVPGQQLHFARGAYWAFAEGKKSAFIKKDDPRVLGARALEAPRVVDQNVVSEEARVARVQGSEECRIIRLNG
jgi:hypothetical protein